MSSHSRHHRPKRSVLRNVTDDIRNSRPFTTIRKETKEVADFYLSDAQREQLAGMSNIKRSWFQSLWILKAMFRKLTPARQAMFIIGIFLLIRVNASVGDNNSLSIDFNAMFGGGLLVLVILLELKEKLLAHDELEAGRKIQESLMPQRSPSVPGWDLWLYTRPANEVCGDLIDFMRHDGGRFSVTMADVAGKGLHAALITTKLQATIRALSNDAAPLDALIGRINTIVHRDSPSHIFSSLFYAEGGEEHGTIRFVNAGHLPALIVRSGAVEEGPKGDPALGLTSAMTFTERSATLGAGEMFVLYSDGLTEAQNELGEFFGKERLVAVLTSARGTAEQTGFLLLRAAEGFTHNTVLKDDLSLIILKRTV